MGKSWISNCQKKKKSDCCPDVHNGLWSRSYVTQPSAKVEDGAVSSHRRHEFTQVQWVGTSAAGPCLSLSRLRSDSSWNPCGDLLSSLLLAAASLRSTCVPWSCLDLHPASLWLSCDCQELGHDFSSAEHFLKRRLLSRCSLQQYRSLCSGRQVRGTLSERREQIGVWGSCNQGSVANTHTLSGGCRRVWKPCSLLPQIFRTCRILFYEDRLWQGGRVWGIPLKRWTSETFSMA